MNFSSATLNNTVEILVGKTDMHTLTPITVATPVEGTVVYAGTPLTYDGEIISNDISEFETDLANAAGILLYDVDTALNPNGTIVQSGPIDGLKAITNCGIRYSSEQLLAIQAKLDNIIFRTNIGVNE